ncbi:hypothetical protein SL055_000628 [Flavobacterium psychrophilum]|jgi:hypothetical protein|nr:hypothetical protein [Flavobacterium psychrophilum]
MKNLKLISTKTVAFLTLFLMVISLSASAQTAKKSTMMKDCCMMKDGKMMVMKDGKTMPMEKDMVMKNGTTCMTNGECTMKNGKKMMMKNGDCMEMSGKMCNDKMKMMDKKKSTKKMAAMNYSCPMHPEVTSDKPGKCSKCGMDLVKKE